MEFDHGIFSRSGSPELAASEREFFPTVYSWMAAGLAVTGLIAWWMALNPQVVVNLFSNSFVFFGIVIAQLAIVFGLSAAINRISVPVAVLGYGTYAALNGVILSSIFLVYTSGSIASTFFITAGTFSAVSFYGYITKKDLTSWGGILTMGLIGLFIASVVNIFWHNSILYWVVSYVGVFLFIGLTAYDTQMLKRIHANGFNSHDSMLKMALLGALKLYLDFINLFLMLLRILGNRRN